MVFLDSFRFAAVVVSLVLGNTLGSFVFLLQLFDWAKQIFQMSLINDEPMVFSRFIVFRARSRLFNKSSDHKQALNSVKNYLSKLPRADFV